MKLVCNIFWLSQPIYNIERNALHNYLTNDPYGRDGLTLKDFRCDIINGDLTCCAT